MAESMLPSALAPVTCALPLGASLGTAVAGVVKDCVDAVARPLPCGEPKTAQGRRQSGGRTRTLAGPAPRPVPAEPWRDRCPASVAFPLGTRALGTRFAAQRAKRSQRCDETAARSACEES